MERRTTQKAFSGYRRILWPTDLSRLARTALPHALQLVAGSKGELVIVHVLTTVAAYVAPELAGLPWDEIDRANRAIGKRKLDRMTKAIKAEHHELRVHNVLAKGVVAEEVLRVARRLRFHLIADRRLGPQWPDVHPLPLKPPLPQSISKYCPLGLLGGCRPPGDRERRRYRRQLQPGGVDLGNPITRWHDERWRGDA